MVDDLPGNGTLSGNCIETGVPENYTCHSTGACAFCLDNVVVYVGSSQVGSAHSGCIQDNKPICNATAPGCIECVGLYTNDVDSCQIDSLGECQWNRLGDYGIGCSCDTELNEGCPSGKKCVAKEDENDIFNKCV